MPAYEQTGLYSPKSMSSDPSRRRSNGQYPAPPRPYDGTRGQAPGLQSQYAYSTAIQSVYPDTYAENVYTQQHSRKRGYDDYANDFFEDAKRSRVEPVYNQAMAQRLSGLDNYISEGWNYVDQDYNTSLPALKNKQDLLEIDQWLYQLSNTVQPGAMEAHAFRNASYGHPQGSIYPNVPNMLQNDYSQSLNLSSSATLYPTLPAGNFAFSSQTPGYNSNTILPQIGSYYSEPRRTIDISQLQAAPSSAKESNVRDTPVHPSVAAPDSQASAQKQEKTEEISKDIAKMSLVDERSVAEEKAKHAKMIKSMRAAIASMLKKMEEASSKAVQDAAPEQTSVTKTLPVAQEC